MQPRSQEAGSLQGSQAQAAPAADAGPGPDLVVLDSEDEERDRENHFTSVEDEVDEDVEDPDYA